MSPSPFLVDAFLAALPHQPVAYPATARAMRLPSWSAGPVGPYNGFAPEERLSNWQLSVILRRLGAFPHPVSCETCGTIKRIGWHAEQRS